MIGEIRGDTNVFQSMLSGQPDMVTNQYLQQQYQQSLTNYSPIAQQFFQQTVGTPYQGMDFEEVNRLAKAMTHHQDVGWINDCVQSLTTIADFQHAPPAMIRWVMAEPTVRERYHQQSIAGYDEYYVDPHPTQVGESHIDYQLAMQGIFHNDGTGNYQAHEWFTDDYQHQTESLDIVDQAIIQRAWASLREHLSSGFEDPTSRFNAAL